MGKCPPSCGGGGGGGGGGCNTGLLQQILSAIQNLGSLMGQWLTEFQKQFDPGGVIGTTDYNPNGTAGTTAIQLYPSQKPVRKAIIQNLSSTDNMTVAFSGQANRPPAGFASGKGTILNKANASGQGGGSMSVNNVDLSAAAIITDTNTGQNYSVYYEV